MPGMKTVFQWLGKNDQFAQQYAHAKQEASDALFEELLDIADNEEGDTQRDRLRVDTRKWMMSKMKPKKYGDRQFVENTHKIDPVERLEAAMERAQRQRAEIEKKIH